MKKTIENDEFLRKRKERQRKVRKRRLVAFFIFFLIILLAVGVALSLTVLFPISNLQFTGSEIYSAEQIADVSGIDIGDNLFNISKRDTLNKLKAKLPYIESVEFERTLPDTLKVTVTDAQKYACYQVDNMFYTVSKSGWVLEESAEQSENVFLVIANGVKCKVGSQLEIEAEDTQSQIDALVGYLLAQELNINYVDVTDNVNLKVGVEGRFDVEFGTENSLENKIRHLSSMIENIEDTKSGKINLSMWNSQNPQGTFVQNNTN